MIDLISTKPAAYNRVETQCPECGEPVRRPPWALKDGNDRCYECDPSKPTYVDEEDPIVSINGRELVADVYGDTMYIGTRTWTGNRTADQHPQDIDEEYDIRRANQVLMVTSREARVYAQRILAALGDAGWDE